MPNHKRNVWIITIAIALVLIGGASAVIYLKISANQISTDKAELSAPVADLSPTTPGILKSVSVHKGDQVEAHAVVAQVGDELIKTTTSGIIINTNANIGKSINPGESVVSMIDPSALRVVGHIDENKGLSDVRIGQHAVFTVDTFGSKKFDGIVDEISPSANSGDVVFNISDKRQTRVFDVKVRFDTTKYPELQNGMSAKLTMYKN